MLRNTSAAKTKVDFTPPPVQSDKKKKKHAYFPPPSLCGSSRALLVASVFPVLGLIIK